jgi:hypothetical protein
VERKKHRGKKEFELFVLKIQSVEIQTHAAQCPHTSPSEQRGHRGSVSSQFVGACCSRRAGTYNADPPLSDLTMLACVLQAAKTPSRNGGPFYGPNRGGPTFSNSRSKIKLRRNRVKNTPQGFTLLLSPLDYTCSVKGI